MKVAKVEVPPLMEPVEQPKQEEEKKLEDADQEEAVK